MAKIKTIQKKIGDLKVYEQNPRRNDKGVKALKESIKDFGITNPILINADDVILAGHTRLKALQEMEVEEVSCIQVTHLSEEEERAFRIADNRVAEFSTWNQEALEAEMKSIEEDDWERFGFKKNQLTALQPPENCTCPKCGKTFIRV